VIAPGGGHSELWIDHEGYNVAAFLSGHGVAGIVLKYRLAREKESTGHGFGVRSATKGPVAAWTARFFDWMGARGLLKGD